MINKISKRDIIEFADKYCSNLTGLGYNKADFISETLNLKRAIRGSNAIAPKHQRLLEKWEESLDKGKPDYSVYSQMPILQDIWSCWAMYSRAYIRALTIKKCNDQFISDILKDTKTILDIGNGIGYSTAALKQTFPNANVYGLNLKESFQWGICQRVAKEYDFKMVSRLPPPNKFVEFDLLFASEYFEHHERPIEHLEEVIKAIKPKFIIVANSFGTSAIGHFREYKHKNAILTIRHTRKMFSDFLKDNNYSKQKTTFWNDRPMFWQINF